MSFGVTSFACRLEGPGFRASGRGLCLKRQEPSLQSADIPNLARLD